MSTVTSPTPTTPAAPPPVVAPPAATANVATAPVQTPAPGVATPPAPAVAEQPKPTPAAPRRRSPEEIAAGRTALRVQQEAEAKARQITADAQAQLAAAQTARQQAEQQAKETARFQHLVSSGDYDALIKEFKLDPNRLSNAFLPAALRAPEEPKTPEQIAEERAAAIANGKIAEWEQKQAAKEAAAQEAADRAAQEAQQREEAARRQQETQQETAERVAFIEAYDRKLTGPLGQASKYPLTLAEGGGNLVFEVLTAFVAQKNRAPAEHELLQITEEYARGKYEARIKALPEAELTRLLESTGRLPKAPAPQPTQTAQKPPSTMDNSFSAGATAQPALPPIAGESAVDRAIRRAQQVAAERAKKV